MKSVFSSAARRTGFPTWASKLRRGQPVGKPGCMVVQPSHPAPFWSGCRRFGVLAVPPARVLASSELAKVRMGEQHPLATRRSRQVAEAVAASALTVAKLVEQYVAARRAGTASSKRLRGRKPSARYIYDTAQYLGRFAAACGRQPASQITRRDIVRFLNDYISKPATHWHVHAAIRRMYAWAQRHDLVTGNPTEHIETAAAPARGRVLSLAELAAIWRAAETLEPLYRDAVHLLITTCQRCGKVTGMRWGEIDLALALWTLPAARPRRGGKQRCRCRPWLWRATGPPPGTPAPAGAGRSGAADAGTQRQEHCAGRRLELAEARA